MAATCFSNVYMPASIDHVQGTFTAAAAAGASSGPARYILTHDAPLHLELQPRSARHLAALTPQLTPTSIKLPPGMYTLSDLQQAAASGSPSKPAHDLSPHAVAAAAAAADAAAPIPQRQPHVAQLQRIFIVTPATTHVKLACQPEVEFKVRVALPMSAPIPSAYRCHTVLLYPIMLLHLVTPSYSLLLAYPYQSLHR